jgi:hypothetical protein
MGDLKKMEMLDFLLVLSWCSPNSDVAFKITNRLKFNNNIKFNSNFKSPMVILKVTSQLREH